MAMSSASQSCHWVKDEVYTIEGETGVWQKAFLLLKTFPPRTWTWATVKYLPLDNYEEKYPCMLVIIKVLSYTKEGFNSPQYLDNIPPRSKITQFKTCFAFLSICLFKSLMIFAAYQFNQRNKLPIKRPLNSRNPRKIIRTIRFGFL